MRVIFRQDGPNHEVLDYHTEDRVEYLIGTDLVTGDTTDDIAQGIVDLMGNGSLDGEDIVDDLSEFTANLDETWGGRL